MLGLSNAIKN